MIRLAAMSAILLGTSTFAVANANAAGWKPAGPIKMMIAFRAGGGADTQARLIAEELEKRKGWRIIPEQVVGKGGTVLATKLKDQPKDGSVIGILVSESLGYNMVAAKRAPFKISDFTLITTTAGAQMGIVALSKSGWKTLKDVTEAAKGGKSIRFGVMSPKLADLAYLLGKANGVEFNIVSFKGGKGVMNALNAGDADIGWIAGLQSKAVKAGQMVNLASGLHEPLKVSPNAPLIKDFGVPYNAGAYFMFVAPAGIPDGAKVALAEAIGDVIKDKSTKANQFITRAFGGPVAISGKQLDNLLATGISDAKKLLAAVSN